MLPHVGEAVLVVPDAAEAVPFFGSDWSNAVLRVVGGSVLLAVLVGVVGQHRKHFAGRRIPQPSLVEVFPGRRVLDAAGRVGG